MSIQICGLKFSHTVFMLRFKHMDSKVCSMGLWKCAVTTSKPEKNTNPSDGFDASVQAYVLNLTQFRRVSL
eukprot:scaffold99713_cov41-Prasinocladus_malaysianus.AAC.1